MDCSVLASGMRLSSWRIRQAWREPDTVRHQDRTAGIARGLARELGLPPEDGELLLQAARLHDLGKERVPVSLLRKPGPLLPEEMALVRRHAACGRRLLRACGFVGPLADLVGAHHERIDGSGYPRGLRGDEVPFLVRVLAVADAFDAMTSPRPYRGPLPPAVALQEMREQGGYDAAVLAACARVAA